MLTTTVESSGTLRLAGHGIDGGMSGRQRMAATLFRGATPVLGACGEKSCQASSLGAETLGCYSRPDAGGDGVSGLTQASQACPTPCACPSCPTHIPTHHRALRFLHSVLRAACATRQTLHRSVAGGHCPLPHPPHPHLPRQIATVHSNASRFGCVLDAIDAGLRGGTFNLSLHAISDWHNRGDAYLGLLATRMIDLAAGAPFDAELPPRITAVSPQQGSLAGGTDLTISGTGNQPSPKHHLHHISSHPTPPHPSQPPVPTVPHMALRRLRLRRKPARNRGGWYALRRQGTHAEWRALPASCSRQPGAAAA